MTAPGAGTPAAPPPGRAAYEAFWANRPPVIGTAGTIAADWDSERQAVHDQWAAVERAVDCEITVHYEAVISQMRAELNSLTGRVAELRALAAEVIGAYEAATDSDRTPEEDALLATWQDRLSISPDGGERHGSDITRQEN